MPPILTHSAPFLLAAGPWWGVPVLALLTGIVLMYLTEFVKSLFARPRLEIDLTAASDRRTGDRIDEQRELLALVSSQYASILTSYQGILVTSAENAATVKMQAGEISRLRDDVKVLQSENLALKSSLERAAVLDSEVVILKTRVGMLETQISAKEDEIVRLLALLQK